ncbi:MAG: hypothetical protein ACFFCT_00095 [Candidatus Odinarchaeota archaeon]
MNRMGILSSLIQQLVDVAYPELKGIDIISRWGRISCFATVSWISNKKNITITCNNQTKKWHEAALIGLLSHELSHLTQMASGRVENKTDIDAIRRGLGIYLAIERIMTGKYEDYTICHGNDMYLGYRSVRSYLNEEELMHLDALLQEMRLIPQSNKSLKLPYHDLIITKTDRMTEFTIDGHKFVIEGEIKESQVEIITRDGISYVYLHGQEIGKYEAL